MKEYIEILVTTTVDVSTLKLNRIHYVITFLLLVDSKCNNNHIGIYSGCKTSGKEYVYTFYLDLGFLVPLMFMKPEYKWGVRCMRIQKSYLKRSKDYPKVFSE